VKVLLRYPSSEAEQGLLARVLDGFESSDPSSFGVTAMTDAAGLEGVRAAVRRVRVEPSLVGYITALVRTTRDAPTITLGASPRASVALLGLAQAAALLDGRSYVVPDDVKSLAPAVLRHRIQIAPELELEGVTPDAAIASLLERVEAPRG
jgi:MoxR-like ATPase